MIEKKELIQALSDFVHYVQDADIVAHAPAIHTMAARLGGQTNLLTVMQREGDREREWDDDEENEYGSNAHEESVAGDSVNGYDRAIDACMAVSGFHESADAAEFLARKMRDDEKLCDLLHERICEKQRYPSAYDLGVERGVDEVSRIADIAATLGAAREDYFPQPKPNEEPVAGMKRYIPEAERFREYLDELGELKGKIANEGRGK